MWKPVVAAVAIGLGGPAVGCGSPGSRDECAVGSRDCECTQGGVCDQGLVCNAETICEPASHCACDETADCNAECPCDLDCGQSCSCDTTSGCDAECDCDAACPSDDDDPDDFEGGAFADGACSGAPITLQEANDRQGELGFFQFELRERDCEIDTNECGPWESMPITTLSWATLASGTVKLLPTAGGGDLRLWLMHDSDCTASDGNKFSGASCSGLGGAITCSTYQSCTGFPELMPYHGFAVGTRNAKFTGALTSSCVQLQAHSEVDYLGTTGDYEERIERQAAILLQF
jgi:hypothetical protein